MFAANTKIGSVRRFSRAWAAPKGAAAALVGLLAFGAAAAQVSASDLQGPDVVVRFGDLDLSTRSGAETLYSRIQRAAAQVCRPTDSAVLVMHTASLQCRNELVARTVASVRSPQLAAVHESHRNDHRPV
jgi:UrcA family protein